MSALSGGKRALSLKRLLAVTSTAIVAASAANAAQTCEIDKARALFGQSPRPNPLISQLLASCVTAGSKDITVFMLQGVMARDEARLEDAVALFERARSLKPSDPSPSLELAVTLEWRHEPQAARALYEEILVAHPDSRPALLGLARVALSQTKLDETRRIYSQLLSANPNDLEARNGQAWAAMADHNLDDARKGFQDVLTSQPGNPTAREGLEKLENAWRYQLDLTGAYVSSGGASAWGSGFSLLTYLDAVNQFEVAQYHYSNQIASVGIIPQALLPFNDYRFGYNYHLAGGPNFSVSYDFRDHGVLPSEHWVSTSIGGYLTGSLQWFAGYRRSFGAQEWDGGLARAGFVMTIQETWEAVGTVYQAEYRGTSNASSLYTDTRNAWAYGIDVNHQGFGASFFNIGVGYSPDLKNLDLHARWVIPVSAHVSLQASEQHWSLNNSYQTTLGMRFNW